MGLSSERTLVGRYALHELIGSGGMARVYVGRLEGWAGFSKAVAVKRLHPDLASDPELSAMLLDEARLTGHIHHPNVVGTIDVVREQGEFLLVMDYVVGVSLDVLLKRARSTKTPMEEGVIVAIAVGILRGLHAAHEATDASGKPLHIVHRDMSPPNVVIEESGLPKVLDFGIATAADRLTTTKEGTVKGKPAYIAPEQLTQGGVDRRADIFSVGVMLGEMLIGDRVRPHTTFAGVVNEVARGTIDLDETQLPSDVARQLGAIARKAMSIAPFERYATAAAMADALESVLAPAGSSHVSAWCMALAPESFESRREAARTATAAATDATNVVTAVESANDTPSKRSRARWIAAVIVPLVAVIAGATVFVRAAAGSKEGSAARANSAVATDTTTPVSPPASSLALRAAPVATPSAEATASAAARKLPRPQRGLGSAPTHVAKPTIDCRIPFVIGDDGMKIPKRECL